MSVLLVTTKGDNCSKQCRPSPSGEVFCATSGECAEGCISGFFGKSCNEICSENCLGDICSFDKGKCTKGCKKNFCGDKCSHQCYLVPKAVSTSTPTTKKHTTGTTTKALAMKSSKLPQTTFLEVTEIYEKGKSQSEQHKVSATTLTSGSLRESPSVANGGGTSEHSKILLYSGISVAVLVVNAAIICFLYVCVRSILYRTNSRIEATHASIRGIELACMPRRTPEVPDAEQPTTSTSYLTATRDATDKDRVVSTHDYDVIDSNNLEPVMLLADCFDDFVTNSTRDACTRDASSQDYSGGRYLSPL